MHEKYLPELEGAYLEDSYFLGLLAEGANLRFSCLFALTVDHANYEPPRTGEQHCYREGSIIFQQAAIIGWIPGKPTIRQDIDGTFDLGSLDIFQSAPTDYRVVTEWFEVSVRAERFRLELI